MGGKRKRAVRGDCSIKFVFDDQDFAMLPRRES